MKKRLFAMILTLVLLLTLPLCGLAELKKGDRGEEVKYMQMMLIEMGFLNDKADGIFGKKTEAGVNRAVILYGADEYQLYAAALTIERVLRGMA